MSLAWTGHGRLLRGELSVRNVGAVRVRLSGKPQLIPLGLDGSELPVPCINTLEFRPPSYVDLDPGETAISNVNWGGHWDGANPSGRFVVKWRGGSSQVTASGPRHPIGSVQATNIMAGWFQRAAQPGVAISGPEWSAQPE